MEYALIGNGGHARETMLQMEKSNMVRFVHDEYWKEEPNVFPLSSFDPTKFKLMVAVGSSKDRYNIINKLPKETQYFTFIHPTALILDNNIEIGEGSFIGAYSILTTNIRIGKHALLNRGNHIGHDTTIGDYFSAMPGAIVSGNCTIYDCVYLGTNSSIKEKLSLHSLTTIGLNSGVVKNIEKPGVYAGSPAKRINK